MNSAVNQKLKGNSINNAFRGISRGSANNKTGQGQAQQNVHPGTSSSQKRNVIGLNNSSQSQNRRHNASQSKNVDFIPIQMMSYISAQKGPLSGQDSQQKTNEDSQEQRQETFQLQQELQIVGNSSSGNDNTVSGRPTSSPNDTKNNDYYGHEIPVLKEHVQLNSTNPASVPKLMSPMNHNRKSGLKQLQDARPKDNGKPTDNIRKLSLAAKAGQMQMQNVVSDHHNQYNSQINLKEVNQPLTNVSVIIPSIGPPQAACSSILSGTLNVRSIAQNAAQNLIIPPPSNLGMQIRESFVNKRQLQQQTMEKKQEPVTKYMQGGQISVLQNEYARSVTTDVPNLNGLKNSGSQYTLAYPAQLMTNLQAGPVPQNKLEFNPNFAAQQHFMQKQFQLSPTTQFLNQRNVSNTNESKTDPNSQTFSILNTQTLNSKRRFNGLSHNNEAIHKVQPVQNLINLKTLQGQKQQKLYEYQHHQLNNSEFNKQQQLVTGISGKQMPITFNQENTNAVLEKQMNLEKHAQQMKQLGGQTSIPTENQVSESQQQNISFNNQQCKVTKKLEASRAHKVYDYIFIQMSNEQFKLEYENKKIFMQKSQMQLEQEEAERRKLISQSPIYKLKPQQEQNLDGLVQIKSYDSVMTDELPMMQCNLLPTQMDHIKMLICEQEDKNFPKLTLEAAARFEIEKQNQIKQYMEDIIIKLKQKERRFKVTVKKKFINDALFNSTSMRIASVYVIVINREKAFDPFCAKPITTKYKKQTLDQKDDESSEEIEDFNKKPINQISKPYNKESVRRSANLNTQVKPSFYESENNGVLSVNLYNSPIPDQMNQTSINENSSKAMQQCKQGLYQDTKKEGIDLSLTRQKPIPTAKSQNTVVVKQKVPKENQNFYQYVEPVKDFSSKYKEPKIRICQDVAVHDHYKKYQFNVYSNQYNEFVRLIFKNQKQGLNMKFNQGYALGLAKVLGMNLKKDAFSEQNMKNREHVNNLKEKLIMSFWKVLHNENREVFYTEKNNNESSEEIDTTSLSIDSYASTNTPKSKSVLVAKNEMENTEQRPQNSWYVKNEEFVYPNQNVNYKYFVGKGNNAIMVKGLLKNRFWWVQGEAQNESDNRNINFMWTQNKVQKVFENMLCKYPNKRSGNKLHSTPLQVKQKKKKAISNLQMSEKGIKTDMKNIDELNKAAQDKTNFKEIKLYNKVEDNFHVNNKKALYMNMRNYYEAIDEDVFDNLPLTFHIKTGFDDPDFKRFEQTYKKIEEEIMLKKMKKKEAQNETGQSNMMSLSPDKEPTQQTEVVPQLTGIQSENQLNPDLTCQQNKNYYRTQQSQKNIWIVKPGENTNRGQGIQVAKDFQEIKNIIAESTQNKNRTCILQKYIHNPLLIRGRKFDIRTYALVTSWNGNMKAYIYEEGYLRTSCKEYNVHNLNNKMIHLTNDAVQKFSPDYGRFEPGNKLSFNEFQQFLDKQFPDLHICFERDLLPQIFKLTVDIFRACHDKLDPKRRLHCMEVFGLDFMIDDEFRPYLIEVNTNPCLELSSPLLARLIPTMLENAFKIGMDPIFVPPEGFSNKKAFIGDPCPENRFTLVYDDRYDGPMLEKLFALKRDIIMEMDEEFSDNEDIHDDDE